MSSQMTIPAILATKLRQAITTAQNDDQTEGNTEARYRHNGRVVAMMDAADFLEGMQ